MTRRQPTRRELRAGSRREKTRVNQEKLNKFLDMHQQGFARGAMGAALGFRPEAIDDLLSIVESGEGEGNR